ncbi:hypothetical protein QVD17_16218 [Tagetes erecta]|uniref:NB-ARC domain-containing protein n=1 Tax=Tagetes erecta TaxID=13708 RepID=A0AAD8P0H9_TARER|nr:hypothetical protein QVD17_16218 [Tagetes erecta]
MYGGGGCSTLPKAIAEWWHESKVIKEIVDTISDKLFYVNSYVNEDLVGMSPRFQELEARLHIGSHDVRMVGVWGVGGGGKTTLASSLYMKISRHFQGHCIIDNNREESSKHGLKTLQEKLLSRLLKIQINLQTVEEGKHIIRSRLKNSNVLILLDDVDDCKQLEALVGKHNWFGSGSRIVITTRDAHLLITHKVDFVCPITLLSHEEAILLFNKHAYKKDNLVNDYEVLSSHVVSYANGLPLALKILGSFLYDKNEKEWLSSLSRLKDIPETEILEKLKISFDGLKSVEKELFLDIACFFRGKSTRKSYIGGDKARDIFEACGYHPDIGIKVLKQKALISIVDGRFDMHDVVQEMGHYIVRGEDPNNPEKHSKVWKHDEILNMCLGDSIMDNDKIEAIQYVHCFTPGHLSRFWPTFLSNELQYISWHNYPRSPFPDNFRPMNLVALNLFSSLQKQLWKGYKLIKFPTIVHMGKLKTLNITYCHKYLEFPDIKSDMESLRKLYLANMGITLLLSSVGHRCPNLISLDLFRCSYLKNKTVSLHGLNHLEEFKLHGLIRSRMPNYKRPWLIQKVVSGRDLHRSQLSISLFGLLFPQLSHSLKKLDLHGCNLKDGEISSNIGEFTNLQELHLGRNDFTRLDFCLLQVTRLRTFTLTDCKWLIQLPELPSSIVILKADYCKSLTTVGEFYTNCKWLCKVSLAGGGVVIDGSRLLQSMRTMLEGNAIINYSMIMIVEGLDIANEFMPPLVKGSRCRVKLPANSSTDFSGFLMCAVGAYEISDWSQWITMEHVLSGTCSEDEVVWEESDYEKRTLVWYVPFESFGHTTWWDDRHEDILFSLGLRDPDKSFSGFGVHLVERKTGSGPIEKPTQEEFDFSNYAPNLDIVQQSQHVLKIAFPKTYETKYETGADSGYAF